MTKSYFLKTPHALLLLISFSASILHCMDQREIDNERLVIAAEKGDLDHARTLLRPRAFVNTIKIQTVKGQIQRSTPLRQAAQNNRIEMLQLLLENKADPNLATDESPLCIAILHDNIKAAEILLKANADPSAVGTTGFTALMAASQQGYTALVQDFLKAKVSVGAQSLEIGGTTALLSASINGHLEIVDLLVNAKADVNQTRTDNSTPLHVAVRNGHKKVTELLLAAGANKNASDCYGHRPDYYATTQEMRELLTGPISSTHERKKD